MNDQVGSRAGGIMSATSPGEGLAFVPFGPDQIKTLLPHRAPILLVDQVTAFIKNDFIVAHRDVPGDDPILAGHFPGNPIVPGVLIVEGMAQAAAIFGRLSEDGPKTSFLFVEINEARFRRPVVPGDRLEYHCKLLRRRGPFFWFDGKATVGGQIAAEAKFSARMQ